MIHRLMPALALGLLSGCLVDPNVAALYETSPPDGSRVEGGTDAGIDLPARDLPADFSGEPGGDLLADLSGEPGSDLPAVDLPTSDLPAPDLGLPPLGSGNARLVYGDTTPTVVHRAWSAASGWSTAAGLLTATKPAAWTLNEVSPTTPGDEAALVLSSDASGTELKLLTRSTAANWSTAWSTTAIAVSESGKRGFDLAYEQSSGDLLVVYSNNTATPRYRTRSGGSWSAEQGLPINLNSGTALWVELVPRPGSNEVALLFADANADLVVVVWDGSQWRTSSAKALETNLKPNSGTGGLFQRCFDGAWEGQSGDLLVAWGVAGLGGYRSATLSGTSWTNLPAFTGTSGEIDFVDLAGQAGSDLIAGVMMDQGGGVERMVLATWSGSAWNAAEYDSDTRDVNNVSQGDASAAVAWVNATTAIAVYADNASGVLDWARWTSGTNWVVQPDVTVAGKGETESVFLVPIPGKSQVMAVFSDSKSQLGAGIYDGTSWTMSQWLSSAVARLDSAPFSLAFQK